MGALRFEHRRAPLASAAVFRARVAGAIAVSLVLVGATLAIGTAGYHWAGELDWLDAFHQAALLLSGMGPVETMRSAAGKLFDSVYALFCGVVLLAATAILFAPLLHRVLHRFHLDEGAE